MAGRLKGKVCLITGAGSGMGKLAAEVFGREGAKVVGLDIKTPAVPEGGLSVAADVSKEADVKAAVAAAVKAYGGVDVLYNNAGIFPSDDHSVVDTEEKVWDKVFAVNVKGVAFVCKYGIPELV